MIETHGETKQNAKTRNALHNFTQSLPTRALQSPVPEKARRARARLANFAIRRFCAPPPQFRRRQPPGGKLFRGAGGRRSKTVFFGVPSACPTCLPTFGVSVGSRARARLSQQSRDARCGRRFDLSPLWPRGPQIEVRFPDRGRRSIRRRRRTDGRGKRSRRWGAKGEGRGGANN